MFRVGVQMRHRALVLGQAERRRRIPIRLGIVGPEERTDLPPAPRSRFAVLDRVNAFFVFLWLFKGGLNAWLLSVSWIE